MNFFTRQLRTVLVVAVAAAAVCWFGCGGGDSGTNSGGNSGDNPGGDNTGGNTMGGGSITGGSSGSGSYASVSIGGMKWMSRNLNEAVSGSWCYGDGGKVGGDYGADEPVYGGEYKTLSSSEIQANCAKYGRLYTWAAAKTACPAGWRLPSRQDWEDLVKAAGGYYDAGEKLKSTTGWAKGGNGSDKYGFSALPGGSRFNSGQFLSAGFLGHWWTATEYGSDSVYVRYMRYIDHGVHETHSDVGRGLSVRCVAN